MMKKFFSVLILLSVAICASASAAISRNPADDPNLLLFYQHQGLESYLYKNSLRIREENSLEVISFDFIVYDSIQPRNTRWDHRENMEFAYDESTRKVYFVDQQGNLDFLDPNGTIAEGSGYAVSAEIVYYIATGKRFYGTYDEEFYEKLPVG